MRILTGLRGVNEGNCYRNIDFVRNGHTIRAIIPSKQDYTLIVRVHRGEDLEVLDCFGIDEQ